MKLSPSMIEVLRMLFVLGPCETHDSTTRSLGWVGGRTVKALEDRKLARRASGWYGKAELTEAGRKIAAGLKT